VEVDGEALMAHMGEVVERLRREKYEDVLAYYDVEVVEGYGRLRSARDVEVGGRVLEGRRIIVATGSRPRIPRSRACRRPSGGAWPLQTRSSSRRGACPPLSSS
jgi:pyruvate/2-oxoglutarate dehydrogenase complex dihydrolipoamide dehydrogenase (E3) component